MKLRCCTAVLTVLGLLMWLGTAFAESPEKEIRLRMQQRHLNRILQMAKMQQDLPEAQKALLQWKLKRIERQLQQGNPSYLEENPQDSLNYPIDKLGPAELP